jgi:hypothetical protein
MIIGCLAIGDVSLALLNFRLQGLKSPCENSNLGAAALTSGVHLLDSKHATLKRGATKPRSVAFSHGL